MLFCDCDKWQLLPDILHGRMAHFINEQMSQFSIMVMSFQEDLPTYTVIMMLWTTAEYFSISLSSIFSFPYACNITKTVIINDISHSYLTGVIAA